MGRGVGATEGGGMERGRARRRKGKGQGEGKGKGKERGEERPEEVMRGEGRREEGGVRR